MWTTVKTAQDWADYRDRTAKTLQVATDRIDWGSGPIEYPCLVCTLFPPRPAGVLPKAYSAFVYQADAEELMLASGRKFLDRDAPVPPNQSQFNRWVTAELLAVISFLVETGICKKDQFETKLLESIELVDAYTSETKEKFKQMLTPSQLTVLDTLNPPK